MSHTLITTDYTALLGRISTVYEKTQQILVEANWHIGKHIVEHLQANENHADYGVEVIKHFSITLKDPRDTTPLHLGEFSYASVEGHFPVSQGLVLVDCGFGVQVREKIRLRGIDCPELGSVRLESGRSSLWRRRLWDVHLFF